MSDFKSPLPEAIDRLWERRAELTPQDAAARAEIVAAVDQVDAGTARAAFIDAETDEVVVDERVKRAILLAFKVLPMEESVVGEFRHHDRVPLKTRLDGVRVVPGAIARWGAYLAPGTVLMPSFTNIGAYVDSGTMVDTWATVGSCAQIGKNVHLSGGVGIGGVLEPPNAVPVIVEGRVHDRVQVDGRGRGAGAHRGGTRRGLDPDRDNARDRRGDREPSCRAARRRPGPCASAVPGCGSSAAVSTACRPC